MRTDKSNAGSPAYYTVRETAWMLGVTPPTASAAILWARCTLRGGAAG